MLINLTRQPLHIYPPGTPDRIEPGSVEALLVIPLSIALPPARLGRIVLGPDSVLDAVPVDLVLFGATGTATGLPAPVVATNYVVSLVVGLAHPQRDDLLVPHEHVRDLDGHVIGSRKLARPHHHW